MNILPQAIVQDPEAAALAQEFGVSEMRMTAFLNRFAPTRVAEHAYRASADTMLFIHIPKTAGVSLGQSLREAFDVFHGVQWNDVAQSFRRSTRTAIYRQSQGDLRQVIMGHFGWPEMQIWRHHELPMKCGTILRDPVTRVVSNYNYNCSEAHPDNANFKARFPTLASFVLTLQPDVQITQAIGLVDSFETVLTKFLTHYTFLGTTESLSASLAHLARSHGLSQMKEYRKNVGRIAPPPEIPADLHRHIEAQSFNDIKLHRLLCQIYAI